MHNYLRFGFFGYSSWQGFNLSRGLEVEKPSMFRLFVRRDEDALSGEEAACLDSFVPREFLGVPALTETSKANGAPNWNHYAFIVLSRELGQEAVQTMSSHPAAIYYKAKEFYLNGYSTFEGRNPYQGTLCFFKGTPQAVVRWTKLYESAVFQYRGGRGVRTGFALLFPILLAAGLIKAAAARKADPAIFGTALFMLFCVVWVLAMVIFVDGREGARMRFSTQPFTWMLSVWAVSGLFKRKKLLG